MISNENALAHKTRSRIHDIIVERPGLTFSEIMRSLRIKESTLRYHLRFLEKKQIVKMRETKGRKLYFSRLEGSRREYRKNLSQVQLKILETVQMDPGLDQKTLVSRMKGNRFLVSYHLQRLMDMGLIRKERDGKHVRYHRISKMELRKRILKKMVDDLLDGDIDEERFIELKQDLEDL